MNSKRKDGTLLSFFIKKPKTVPLADVDPDDPSPCPEKSFLLNDVTKVTDNCQGEESHNLGETLNDVTKVTDNCQGEESHNLGETVIDIKEVIENDDISYYVGKTLNFMEKIELMNKNWWPDPSKQFPISGKRRLRFQYTWFGRWNWLVYSMKEQGAYCKFCVLFGCSDGGRGHQRLGQLVVTSFNNWKNATTKFNDHMKTDYHQTATTKADDLLKIYKNKKVPIDVQLNSCLKEEIEKNRLKIRPIIETVILCGRQGLATRGHNDSERIIIGEEPIENDGNFRALLRYRVNGGDDVLKNHLIDAPKNATYISGKMQNQIINICGTNIQRKIVAKVNKTKCFSVLADETADISGIEQFSICVRYFDDDIEKIREDFLVFVPVYDTTGKGLASKIIETLSSLDLDLKYLRGQGYDGASAMSGCFNGAKTHIIEKYPLAYYLHCTSHSLNLAVSNACTVKSIRNTIGTIQETCVFFKYPKRLNVLNEVIDEVIPSTHKKRLKMMCPTRWVERHDAVMVFIELFKVIIMALENICEWLDTDTSSKAKRLLISLQNPEFIITTHIVGTIFAITMPLSRQLQTENMDLVNALKLADDVQCVLKSYRENAANNFHQEFQRIVSWYNDLELEDIDFTKLSRHQKKYLDELNISGNKTAEQYYRLTIYVPFLDNFVSQLHDRFLNHHNLLKSFHSILPGYNIDLDIHTDKNFKYLIDTYKEDLNTNELVIIGEMKLWQKKCQQMNPSSSALDVFYKCNEIIFPNVHKLLKILITLPVTTASGERSFSTLRRLKSYLRSTTSETRLNGLSIMNIHRDIPLTVDEVINELASQSRRLNFRLD